MFEFSYNSPTGQILITYDDTHILGLVFDKPQTQQSAQNELIGRCVTQLDDYFRGNIMNFDLPINPIGTDFRRTTWDALQTIPFGETRTYGQIAEMIGNPKASRAVGCANGKNPIYIIVPCHRVIGASGKLVGYAGGMERKIWLLNHEKSIITQNKK